MSVHTSFSAMADFQRPLTVCLSVGDGNGDAVSSRDVVLALTSIVEDEEIKCVTQTRRHGFWQMTLATEATRDVVLGRGLDINFRHYQCTPLVRLRPPTPPAFVSVKMPYEMPDSMVTERLSLYGRVTNVHRRCYSFASTIETGVRVFTVREQRGCFPTSIQLGRYFLRLYCGVSVIVRCSSDFSCQQISAASNGRYLLVAIAHGSTAFQLCFCIIGRGADRLL